MGRSKLANGVIKEGTENKVECIKCEQMKCTTSELYFFRLSVLLSWDVNGLGIFFRNPVEVIPTKICVIYESWRWKCFFLKKNIFLIALHWKICFFQLELTFFILFHVNENFFSKFCCGMHFVWIFSQSINFPYFINKICFQ